VSEPVRIATATVSDTRSSADDRSGQRLVSLMEEAGYEVVGHRILRDEPSVLVDFLAGLADARQAVAAILTGGTGIAPRDHTYEALTGLFEKRLDGFGEAFRRLSWDEIGPRGILSRATAGTFRGLLLFSLPGSPAAVELGVNRLILPLLPHALDLIAGRASHGEAGPK
jgi:molybdopterin adenylyltransferase